MNYAGATIYALQILSQVNRRETSKFGVFCLNCHTAGPDCLPPCQFNDWFNSARSHLFLLLTKLANLYPTDSILKNYKFK